MFEDIDTCLLKKIGIVLLAGGAGGAAGWAAKKTTGAMVGGIGAAVAAYFLYNPQCAAAVTQTQQIPQTVGPLPITKPSQAMVVDAVVPSRSQYIPVVEAVPVKTTEDASSMVTSIKPVATTRIAVPISKVSSTTTQTAQLRTAAVSPTTGVVAARVPTCRTDYRWSMEKQACVLDLR